MLTKAHREFPNTLEQFFTQFPIVRRQLVGCSAHSDLSSRMVTITITDSSWKVVTLSGYRYLAKNTPRHPTTPRECQNYCSQSQVLSLHQECGGSREVSWSSNPTINVASTVFGRGTEVRREISKSRLRRVTCAVEASDVAFTTVPGCTF